VLGLNRAALAEGLAYGEARGFDGALLLRVLQAGPAASRIMETKGPKMLARDYSPEARLRQHHKDVRLMLASGRALPLTEAHERILAAAEAMGLGDEDNSALIEVYRRDIVTGQ
jgi:3-hydroxyisobutyrate dehydrogenase-like beta-hydroxyacid dehydrogenase